MTRTVRMSVAAGAIWMAAFASACSSSGDVASSRQTDNATEPAHHAEAETGYDFGQPGDVSRIDRVIKVVQLDSLRFNPDDIAVSAGGTVRFQIFNEGTLPHEFVIGDKEFQEEHERLMGETGGEMLADSPNAVYVEPGAQKSLTWTFTEAGTVLFACHVAGHYSDGMVGSVHVGK